MKCGRVRSFALAMVLLGATAASGQDNWQKIAPVGHMFSVMMPARATPMSRRIHASATESIPAYLVSAVSQDKRFVAAGFYKTASDVTPLLSSFENFVAAMEYGLNHSQNIKSATLRRDLSSGNLRVKEYDFQIGSYFGTARFIGSQTGFYALVFVGSDARDSHADRFFSSFRVGELNTDTIGSGINAWDSGVITATKPTAQTANAEQAGPATGVVTLADKSPGPPPAAGSPPEPWPDLVGLIRGGVVNGKAVSLPQPKYPQAARKTRDEGRVKVQIVIDELGNVSKAEVVEGPESVSLREAALNAARNSRFTPTFLMGQPVKVSGVLIYNFVAQ